MSDLALEMQTIVFGAAEPLRADEKVKARMRRAHIELQKAIPDIPLRFWRVRAAWNREAGCWSGRAIEDLRRRHARRVGKEAKARAYAEDAVAALCAARDRLAAVDADFYREQILAIEQAICRAGGEAGR